MITLDKEQVKRLHKKLLDATGGLAGHRDETMLDSALAVAFQTFNGVEFYPSTDDDIICIGFDLANGKMSDKQLLDLILERLR